MLVSLQNLIHTSRMMFGRHKQGYIFPLQINATIMDSTFYAVMQAASTQQEFIWFYSQSLRICAATEGSVKLLGVSRRRCISSVVLAVPKSQRRLCLCVPLGVATGA